MGVDVNAKTITYLLNDTEYGLIFKDIDIFHRNINWLSAFAHVHRKSILWKFQILKLASSLAKKIKLTDFGVFFKTVFYNLGTLFQSYCPALMACKISHNHKAHKLTFGFIHEMEKIVGLDTFTVCDGIIELCLLYFFQFIDEFLRAKHGEGISLSTNKDDRLTKLDLFW